MSWTCSCKSYFSIMVRYPGEAELQDYMRHIGIYDDSRLQIDVNWCIEQRSKSFEATTSYYITFGKNKDNTKFRIIDNQFNWEAELFDSLQTNTSHCKFCNKAIITKEQQQTLEGFYRLNGLVGVRQYLAELNYKEIPACYKEIPV